MDLGVKNKGYVVVGGTSGMGFATAEVLAAEGAKVVVVGRDGPRAAGAVERLKAGGSAMVWPVLADISDSDSVTAMVDQSISLLGGIDGVAILTGILGHDPIDASDDLWIGAFQDVLLGTVRVIRTVLPHMVERGGGTLVTTSAYSIRDPHSPRMPYTSLKAAVAVFTKGIAKTYGRQGVRANCVCPGAIETEPLHELRAVLAKEKGYAYEEAIERVMEEEWGLHTALGRPGQPHEVGELVAMLLSPKAGYVTGATINIDGGTNF
jgi:3-oxoacyl-[acyl-carrier protein] reductase